MFLIRPIEEKDLDSLERFAESTALGMISLPKNRIKLGEKIKLSQESFQKKVSKPDNEFYLFVLENTLTGEIGGSCGIYAKTGIKEPLYFFRLEDSLLFPHTLTDGPSELCALFMQKNWRKEGLGHLLSFSRFLFIASHPERFEEKICARLRGVIDKNKKTSPFWNGVGSHFLSASFEETQRLQQEGTAFIPTFLPEYPIYTCFLSKSARKVMGKSHKTTVPAEKMLLRQGFKKTTLIDLFDGGPILEHQTRKVRTVEESSLFKVHSLHSSLKGHQLLLSNSRLDFRCCLGFADFSREKEGFIEKSSASLLNVQPGDFIRAAVPSPH